MNIQPKKNKGNQKPLIYGVLISLITALVFFVTIYISFKYLIEQKHQLLQNQLITVKENIRKVLSSSNFAAFSIGLTIDPASDTVKNFEYVAQEIMDRYPYFYGVQILRKGEIQFVYPYEIHQSVMGYDILEDPSTRIEAEKAISRKEIYYAGPFIFKQGDSLGIIGRLPIYHEDKFWGFSAVLINFEDFLAASGISNSKFENISFQFSKINPNTNKEEVFLKNRVNNSDSIDYIFNEAGWKIEVFYHREKGIYLFFGFITVLALLSSIGCGLYTFQLLKRPQKLEKLLADKTKEVNDNNQYLTSMVSAIPDLIFIYNKKGKYLDFHAYQESLLMFSPKKFIGKRVDELFDKKFAQEINDNIQSALKSGEIVEHSYYYDFKDGRKHFESRYIAINDEKVFSLVRDVTSNKLALQKVENSEEKYRNLVEHALDAIFIADEKGNFIELNSHGLKMTGIKADNLAQHNLNDFIVLVNEKNHTFTQFIQHEGLALKEAVLIPINNPDIPIEISSNITPKNQIQGIIRDISPRKKYIDSIRRQNEKLKEIAWIQSHEVRAPLARLLGLLNYLEKYENTDYTGKKEIIEAIRASALELDFIIRDVVSKTEFEENMEA